MNYAFGDWSDATPDNMQSWPEDKLLCAITLDRGGVYSSRAQAALTRRQNERISVLLEHLGQITVKVSSEVKGLATEVKTLSSSSDRLEALTRRLNGLTIALVALTILAVIVPVGIEVYHAQQEDKKPTAVQTPSTTEPQSAQPTNSPKPPQ
jgi:hypothetical protein